MLPSHRIWFLVLFAFVGAGLDCVPEESGPSGPVSRGGAEASRESPYSRMANRLGFALLQHEARLGRARILISPHGVASALLLAWNGTGGETREAITQALGLPPGTDFDEVNPAWGALDRSLRASEPQLRLAIANSLWARQGAALRPAFIRRAASVFGAEVRNLDFSAAEAAGIVNRWVEDSTGGKIAAIVPDPIPADVVLYVINALYFKGEWSEQFDEAATRPRNFLPDGGEPREVPMMERSGSWSHLSEEDLQAVRLPYGQGRFAMYVVLPAAGRLEAWLRGLSGPAWEAIVSSLTVAEGRVVLPRFQFAHSAKLRAPLRDLGMGVAFGAGADFSALTPKPVAISDVIHKSFIEVNEQGAEVAAATEVEIADVAVGPTPFEFTADRPFFFAIRDDQSGALLFVGVVRSID